MTKPNRNWTLVQHSAYGYAGDTTFKRGVEMQGIDTKAALLRVQKAGGMVFDSYDAASEAEYNENYPDNVKGIVPKASGSFSSHKVNGLAIYIPAKKSTP
jgi:hypothetical protein